VNWYYALNNQQLGPVDEQTLQGLVSAGTINGQTLVWREGMGEWVALSIAPNLPPDLLALITSAPAIAATGSHAPISNLPPGKVRCAECGGIFPPEETIQYGTQNVCGACKPIFLQRLREGAGGLSTGLVYATIWKRFFAKIVDGVLLGIVGFGCQFLIIMAMGGDSENVAAIVVSSGFNMIVGLLYTSILHWKFGATLGKMALSLKVIRPDGSSLSYPQALGRSAAEYVSSCICLIGYIMAAFDDEKRSLHDRMCNTRVIISQKSLE
jgi:uncharacterized RDD family membrane protein YckC